MLLTAQDERGRRFILQKEQTSDDLKKLRDKHQFHCEVCLSPVTLKIGEHVSPHFAHKPHFRCEGDNEPESVSHREGKWSLFHWLQNQCESPVLEQYFPNIKQRADIGLPDRHWVIEYQCSNLSHKRFTERTKGYLGAKLQPFWILGADRLRQLSTHVFKLMQTDFFMIQHDSNRTTSYAIFFNARNNYITFLYDFWPLTANVVIADCFTIPFSDLMVEQLFIPPFPKPSIEKKQLAWLTQKEKWRQFRNPHPGKLESYVLAICQRKGLSLSFFPSYVGLPIPNDLVITTPPYLWQAWIVLQFLYQRPIGTILDLKSIESAFQRLIAKKVIFLRDGKKSFAQSIEQYMKALEQFSIIERRRNRQFIIKKAVSWQAKSITEFSQEDGAALWRWLELNL